MGSANTTGTTINKRGGGVLRMIWLNGRIQSSTTLLRCIGMIKSLRSMYIGGDILSHESITVEEGIKEFSQMDGKFSLLERLDLKRLCSITDSMMDSMDECRSLRTLTVDGT